MRKTTQQGRPARRAHELLLSAAALLALLALPAAVSAQQWTTTTSNPANISNSNSGNVGVGTTAPAYELHVESVSAPVTYHLQGYFRNTGATYQYGGVGVDAQKQSHIRFFLNGLPKWQWRVGASGGGEDLQAYSWALGRDVLSITGGGNVGIGTSAPDNHLHIYNAGGMGMLKVTGRDGGLINVVDPSAPAGQQDYQWRSEDGVFRMALAPDSGAGTLLQQNILVANSSGNVGVGTLPATMRLDVRGAADQAYPNNPALLNLISTDSAAQNIGGGIRFGGSYTGTTPTTFAYVGGVKESAAGDYAGRLVFGTRAAGTNAVDMTRMVIDSSGRVGIGTTTPGAGLPADPQLKLDVQGNVNVSGYISATYQDVAEWVPSAQKLQAGTVVVLDDERANHVVASTVPYDTKVAGVVSAAPGVILGTGGEGKVKVATTGRVKVKADATRGAIKVGDLLVTSDAEGVAMKSVPVDLGGAQIHRPGTIIGKALEPLASGTGEILVLLSLQ
ncbi:MAG TPA: hypothetical protein VE642_03310 [Pyrinomonadaceae bacterium]|nr:hypothetical protein [Pyrinomonadaceae bacterium]